MNFSQAIVAGFTNAFNFRGRALRSEFWWWSLFGLLVGLVATILDTLIFGDTAMVVDPYGGVEFDWTAMIFTLIISAVLLVPNLSISVRRLHDGDHSGWWLLIYYVPAFAMAYLYMELLSSEAFTRIALGQNVSPEEFPAVLFWLGPVAIACLVGGVWLLVWFITRGTLGPNRFGPPRDGSSDPVDQVFM